MDTAIYRKREAPLPPALRVSAKSHERWLKAFDISQRLFPLGYIAGAEKARKFEPEFRAMVLLRLAAFHHLQLDTLPR